MSFGFMSHSGLSFMAFSLMPFGLMSPSGIYVVRVKFFWDIVVLYTVGVGTPGPGWIYYEAQGGLTEGKRIFPLGSRNIFPERPAVFFRLRTRKKVFGFSLENLYVDSPGQLCRFHTRNPQIPYNKSTDSLQEIHRYPTRNPQIPYKKSTDSQQ